MKQARETWASFKEGLKVTINQESFRGMCCCAVVTRNTSLLRHPPRNNGEEIQLFPEINSSFLKRKDQREELLQYRAQKSFKKKNHHKITDLILPYGQDQ